MMAEKATIKSSSKRKGVFSSAQKARLVADLIRGMKYVEAMNQLTVMDKKVAKDFIKALKNAHNAVVQKVNIVDDSKLVLTEVMVGEARTLKRYIARAKGRGDRRLRRFCDIYITLTYKV